MGIQVYRTKGYCCSLLMLPELKYLFEHILYYSWLIQVFFYVNGKYLWTALSQILEALFKPIGIWEDVPGGVMLLLISWFSLIFSFYCLSTVSHNKTCPVGRGRKCFFNSAVGLFWLNDMHFLLFLVVWTDYSLHLFCPLVKVSLCISDPFQSMDLTLWDVPSFRMDEDNSLWERVFNSYPTFSSFRFYSYL